MQGTRGFIQVYQNRKSFFSSFLNVQVHDRRHEEFVPRKPKKRFPGVGQAVHGHVTASEGQHAVGVPSLGPGLTLTLPPNTSSLGSSKKVGVEHFLSRLPKAIVKAGHVIDIRTPVRETLQVGNCCCCVSLCCRWKDLNTLFIDTYRHINNLYILFLSSYGILLNTFTHQGLMSSNRSCSSGNNSSSSKVTFIDTAALQATKDR